jgi:small subunit ribosomal protein S6
MPFYESVFIARQDISAEQADALATDVTNIITSQGGQVTKKEYWGLRTISFKIKKNRKGHYTLLNIDAPAPAILEMERQMRIHEDILRFLTVRVDALEEGPSMMMQRGQDRDRGERGDRGDRGDRPPRDRGDRDRGDRGGDRGGFRARPRDNFGGDAPRSNQGDRT